MNTNQLFDGYENMKHRHYEELDRSFPNSFWYDELPQNEIKGVLKANRYVDGRLLQVYSLQDNHVGVIAATRLGKTTSYMIPTVLSFSKAKNKKSMFISDPKGEIYRQTAATLREEGYEVLCVNFRDWMHSECWNPLTPIYRKYQAAINLHKEVAVVDTENGPRNSFLGKIYESQEELDHDLKQYQKILIEDVANEIDSLALIIAPTKDEKDPYWGDSAREVVKAILWGMLEDSNEELVASSNRTLITEDSYSFNTLISVADTLNATGDAYFNDRRHTSRAYRLANSALPQEAKITRDCVLKYLGTDMAKFKEGSVKLITSCNSFDLKILTEDKPVALFVGYRDELKIHFDVISMFVQNVYRLLIEHANMQPDGKRNIPFYFLLDEFGNFPAITDFETVISACAGRNIFFILIIQSYAQLERVYGCAVAAIIRDNLNMHVFFGSNNPQTLEEFSVECGYTTRLSPLAVMNGKESEMDYYNYDTIRLIPKSELSYLKPSEGVITEANCGYVLSTRLERYYMCKEFTDVPLSDVRQYVGKLNPLDDRYNGVPIFRSEDKKTQKRNFGR